MPPSAWPDDPEKAKSAAERLALCQSDDDGAARRVRRFWVQTLGAGPEKLSFEDVRCALDEGRLDDASLYMARLRVRPKLDPRWHALRLELSLRRGDRDGVKVALARSSVLDALSLISAKRLVETAMLHGDLQTVITITDFELTRTSADPALHRSRIAALALSGDEGAFLSGLDAALDNLAEPPAIECAVELALITDTARRDGILQRIEEKWRDARLVRKVRHLTGKTWSRPDLPDETPGMARTTSAALLARHGGDDRAADRWLSRLIETGEAEDALVAQRIDAIRRFEPFDNLRRPLISSFEADDVAISQRGDSGVSVLVFCGLNNEVGLPIEVFDAFLAQRGISAVYLSDRRHAAFMAGVASLGADWHETDAALAGILKGLGTKRLFTIGNSAGGIGALSHGLSRGAEGILSYSGIMAADTSVRAAIGDRRGRLIAHRAFKARGSLSHGPAMFEATSFRPRTHWYYGEDMDLDRKNVALMQNFENARLFPLAAPCGHQAVWRLFHDGKLGDTIDALIAA